MMKALVRKTDKRIMHINGGPFGVMTREDCWAVPIPDQDITGLYVHDEIADIDTIKELYYPTDIQTYDKPLADLVIDSDTGSTIDVSMHPVSGIDEQLGILRDQLVHILNALGLEPTPDFAQLNEIAVKAVNDGAQKKAAL